MEGSVKGEKEPLVREAYPSSQVINHVDSPVKPSLEKMFGPFPPLQVPKSEPSLVKNISDLASTKKKIEELRNLILLKESKLLKNVTQAEVIDRPASAPPLPSELIVSSPVSEDGRSNSEPLVEDVLVQEAVEIYDGEDMIISDDDDEPVIIAVQGNSQTTVEVDVQSASPMSIEEHHQSGENPENAYVIDDDDDENDEANDGKSERCPSESSYTTADEIPLEDDHLFELTEKVKSIEDEMNEKQAAIRQMEEANRQLDMKLLKLKVQLSINRNRKENTKRPAPAENQPPPPPPSGAAIAAPAPAPGYLYVPPHRANGQIHMDDNTVNHNNNNNSNNNNNNNNGYNNNGKNRHGKRKRNSKNFNQHQHQHQHQHQQQQQLLPEPHLVNYEYTPYYFSHQLPIAPPPPPPPPSVPPPLIPPPPPPPPLPALSSSSNTLPLGQEPTQYLPSPTRSYSLPVNKKKKRYKQAVDGADIDSNNSNSNNIEPLEGGQMISGFLKEIQQFITLRVNDDVNEPAIIIERPLPRPCRLVTIDGYTMPMDMIVLDQEAEDDTKSNSNEPSLSTTLSAGKPAEVSLSNVWYESPFFVMLRRKGAHQSFSPVVGKYVDSIISTISVNPTDIDTFQEKAQFGIFPNKLNESLAIVTRAVLEHPENEFLATLKVELSLYVHGLSPAFQEDYDKAVSLMPQSVDIRWQRIRAEKNTSAQIALILEFIHSLSSLHPTFDTPGSLVTSSATAEVLIRLLRLDGLDKVLSILTNDNIKINRENVEVFPIDGGGPGVHLTEQDRYNLWMLILYYYATGKKLPDSVCSSWMNSFVKDGTPNRSRILFMIDWTPALSDAPLDRPSQIGVISILLSMLQHFSNKACADARRRPLLIGVWRTLCNILTFTPCYKRAATLILIRKGLDMNGLRPEIQEIATDLEIRLTSSAKPILSQIPFQGREVLPFTSLSAINYRLAKTVYDETRDLSLVARILYLPIHRICGEDQIELEKSPDDQTRDQKIVQVDRIRQGYLTVLGLDSLLPINTNQQRKISLATYSWMNLLLLTQISKCLYPETSPVRESLKNQMEMIFSKGMENIISEDGKMIFFKYKMQLTSSSSSLSLSSSSS